MAQTADTVEDQELAREAFRIADHAYDRFFTIAMLEAALSPPPSTPKLKEIAARIDDLKGRIAAGQEQVAALAKALSRNAEETLAKADLAKAQLTLDQEELAEAQADLARNGGDRRANLERLRKLHAEGQHSPAFPPVAAPSSSNSLFQEGMTWYKLRTRAEQVAGAQQLSLNVFASRLHQRQSLSSGAAAAKQKIEKAQEEDEEETQAIVERLSKLSDQRKIIAQLDQTTQDALALAALYQRWRALLDARQIAHLRNMLLGLAFLIAILLGVVLTGNAVRHTFRNHADRRRAHQMRVMLTIAAQIVGGLVIALVIFGPPTQLSTILGLATAGLTVVLKDFIVAFFGWFILMGKNGLRIGDWVEIEGVGGEVVEIGLLKTVLLEMGNWTNTGHPTGRRVAFVNKFAIERHFFNFSTAGQWLWDELQMTLPPTGDAYRLSMQVRDLVERETETDARLAEEEWERATRQYETNPFSARPAVDLRPSANGLDVMVRYITRAPRRYDVKSRLFQAIVELIHKPNPAIEQPRGGTE